MSQVQVQQAVSGFNTTLVIGGPCVVRVHEAHDAALTHTKHRYFISVDFKFRQNDALNIGNAGYFGVSKAEATREANDLAKKISVAYNALESAKAQALNWDTFTNRHTQRIQEEAFNKIVGRYTAEFI